MKMHSATLCLGSNIGVQAIDKIILASDYLEQAGAIVCRSSVYGSPSGYLNQVLILHSEMEYDDLHTLTKELESKLGRRPEHKAQGIVPVDIDIVIFDEEVIRPLDYDSAYFNQGLEELQA